MNTTLKLCLYCSIERNLDVGKTCIFLFGGIGVGSLLFSTYGAKTPGMGLNERYFEVDYECTKWSGCKSSYDEKLAYQRPKTTLLLKKSL